MALGFARYIPSPFRSVVEAFWYFTLINRGSQTGTLVYYVFDLLKLCDVDLRWEPLLKRKRLLQRLEKGHPGILYVDHMEREGLGMFAGALGLGLEGIVAKDSQSPHVEGPAENRFWLKENKDFKRKEPVEFPQKNPP